MSAYNGLCVAPNQADVNNAVGVPTGAINLWSTTTPPTGWLLCDGTGYSKFDYPALFEVIGNTWGYKLGTSANITSSVGSVGQPTQLTITFFTTIPTALTVVGSQFLMSNRGFSENLNIWTVFSTAGLDLVATATQNGSPVTFTTTPNNTDGTVTPIVANSFAVPNTSQKVVRGIYPVNYEITTTGGADTITISADNLPQHRHGITSFVLSGPTGTGGGSLGVSAGQYYTAADQTYTNASTPTLATNSAIDSRNAYISIPYIIKT
jgi:hypothetical protein